MDQKHYAKLINEELEKLPFYVKEFYLAKNLALTTKYQYLTEIIRDTVSKKGADSTYQTTLDCSKYIFYIDQTKHEIYNPDSLPVGIDCKKIICNVTSKGSSVTLVKNIDSDTLQAFETIDSMDFSKPRTLRMVSMSGRASCDYTVKVNIHKQKPNIDNWSDIDIPNLKMTYKDTNAWSDFINAVRLQGDIRPSMVSMNTLGYFAPALKRFRMTASLNGHVEGYINDLHLKNIKFESADVVE